MATLPSVPLRIFVSHSQHNNDFGVKLVDDLRRALGDESAVWFDSHGGLHGGDFWWPKIVAELQTRNVFIVILSPEAIHSKWVNDEINLAWLQRNKTGMHIIPVLYRKCEIPEYLNLVQIISFLAPRTYEEAFNELLEALGLAAQPVPTSKKFPRIPSAVSTIASSAKKRVSGLSKERWIQIVALLIIVFGIVLSSIWMNQGVTDATKAAVLAKTVTAHYPFSDHEVLSDPLLFSTQRDPWKWSTAFAKGDICEFTDQGYVTIEPSPNYFAPCFASNTNFKDFTYEVTMTIVQGDCGGLIFRSNATQTNYYLFYLCQNGYYLLQNFDGKHGNIVIPATPSGFNIGLNYPISIAVVAQNNKIRLYIDNILVGQITNNLYSQGRIGLVGGPLTEVIFTNARVWILP